MLTRDKVQTCSRTTLVGCAYEDDLLSHACWFGCCVEFVVVWLVGCLYVCGAVEEAASLLFLLGWEARRRFDAESLGHVFSSSSSFPSC